VNSRSFEQYDRLIRDLNEERAAALRRIAGTLQGLIDELHSLADLIAQLSPEDRPAGVERYRALRRQAIRYRWYLEVQREALGLRQHRVLDEFYAIPEPLAG